MGREAGKGRRILMLLENNSYRQDPRVRREAESLSAAGYAVAVICPKGPGSERTREVVAGGVVLYQYPAPMGGGGFADYFVEYGWSLVAMFALSLLVALREGFDIVHAHNPPDTMSLIAAFYKLFGKSFVFDHHDLSQEMYRARYGAAANPRLSRMLLWFERFTFRQADHVISTNDSYRKVAIQRGGLAPGRVTVVRNGPDAVDADLLDRAADRTRSRSADAADTVLGYVGIMGPQDGVDLLLQAIAVVVNDLGRSDVTCTIVGKGDSLDSLRELAESLGIADRTTFVGWVPSEELPSYLLGFDICVDPDPSNEYNDRCTMIKMMEYMAFGRPIVAFDLPEHRITAGDAAVYASNNDVAEFARLVVELIDDPDRRRRMGEVGRKRIAEGLSWAHQEVKLVEAYETLAKGGPRPNEA
jgi:glycosyltransferase involved in cell wall biosynthesis